MVDSNSLFYSLVLFKLVNSLVLYPLLVDITSRGAASNKIAIFNRSQSCLRCAGQGCLIDAHRLEDDVCVNNPLTFWKTLSVKMLLGGIQKNTC